MTSFVVSGGDFLRSEGCLSFIELEEDTGRLRLQGETWVDHPRPGLAVRGKGFTGLCAVGGTAWACFSNLLVRVALPEGGILDLIEDADFNDLHQLSLTKEGLIVANTGNETVDTVSMPARTITRIDLLGSDLRAARPPRARNEDTKPHVHHVSSVSVNSSGELILGLGRQARILNLTRWAWVGPRMPAPMHDVRCDADDAVWCTTLGGEIYRIPVGGEPQSWSLRGRQDKVGWTRGLAVTARGLLVGTTAIRESNRDYYHSLVQAEVGQVEACLTWIPFDGGPSSILTLPSPTTRKVFAICGLEQAPWR